MVSDGMESGVPASLGSAGSWDWVASIRLHPECPQAKDTGTVIGSVQMQHMYSSWIDATRCIMLWPLPDPSRCSAEGSIFALCDGRCRLNHPRLQRHERLPSAMRSILEISLVVKLKIGL